MKIIIDKSYTNQFRMENGISIERPFKINVHRCWGKDITPLMDEIESKFRVYQYDMNNNVKYGEQELFFWTNKLCDCLNEKDGKMNFFTLNLNKKTSPCERESVLNRLLPIIEAWDGSVIGEKKIVITHMDGTKEELNKSPSYASVDYHDELIDSESLHQKAMMRMREIGNRKCECGGIVGRFRYDEDRLFFQKFRTSKFYELTDEAIACARIVD